jgi:Leucine-rich repeat (LRR) protein
VKEGQGGRVTLLQLSGNKLTGKRMFSSTPYNIKEKIYLMSGEIPASIGNLTNLTLLWLSKNQLQCA